MCMFCRSLLVLLCFFFWSLSVLLRFTDSDFGIFKLFLHHHSSMTCMYQARKGSDNILYVLWVSIYNFGFDFGTVLTVWYLVFSVLMPLQKILQCLRNSKIDDCCLLFQTVRLLPVQLTKIARLLLNLQSMRYYNLFSFWMCYGIVTYYKDTAFSWGCYGRLPHEKEK